MSAVKHCNMLTATLIAIIMAIILLVYIRIDKLVWTVEMLEFTGFEYTTLVSNPPANTYIFVVPSEENAVYISSFRGRQKPPPKFTTLLYASHKKPPGTSQALIYSNSDGIVVAVSVASMDTEQLERMLAQ